MNAKNRLAFNQEIALPCLKASVPTTALDSGTAVCYTEYVSKATGR